MEWQERLRANKITPDGLSKVKLKRLFDHQIWLGSEARFGERLVIRDRDFDKVNLDGIDLSRAVIVNASFDWTTLRDARFTGAELRYVQFTNCDVRGADFRGARLEQVCFAGANYQFANFDGVDTVAVHWTVDSFRAFLETQSQRVLKPPIIDR